MIDILMSTFLKTAINHSTSVWIFFQNFAVSFENAMEGQGVGRFYSEKWNNTTIKKHLALRRKLIQRMNGSSKIRFR
ncbi:uncharacterized protein OCT59_015246 [Rhizophagus irregularis]|uniref:uncharacterized protein n=1 Tax=Rhizophagus irregularis TaxID=588596 RepID=UPI003321D24A|nr:hypothetical protein OCT59_015246 [Rhizophagus irregularis]